MDLYREEILDHYRNPHNFGNLKSPDVSYSGNLISCGDSMTMEAIVEKGKVKEISFNGEGCAISTATASLLTDFAAGKEIEKLMKLKTQDILDLIQIELTPTRLKCALLPLEVLQKMLVKC